MFSLWNLLYIGGGLCVVLLVGSELWIWYKSRKNRKNGDEEAR